jgi:hypothetical protein
VALKKWRDVPPDFAKFHLSGIEKKERGCCSATPIFAQKDRDISNKPVFEPVVGLERSDLSLQNV